MNTAGRIALVLVCLSGLGWPQTVTVENVEVPYVMKDGRMLVLQRELAPALPDLEPGDETYDLLDILNRHPDLRATKRDGVVVRVRYYPQEKADQYLEAHPQAEVPREPQQVITTTTTPARKASWRNESAFAEGDYKVTVPTGGGRITNQRGQTVSSSAEDRRQGKFASQKEYEMNTYKTGRHTRPGTITINGEYKEGHYYVRSEDKTLEPSKDQPASESHDEVEVTPVNPVIHKEVEGSKRYYIPVTELERLAPAKVRL